MMGQRNGLEGGDYHAGGTCDQLETTLSVGTVTRVYERTLAFPRLVSHHRDILRVQNTLFAQLQIQSPTVLNSADILVPNNVSLDHRGDRQPQ